MSEPEENIPPWEELTPAPPLNKEAYQRGYSHALGQHPPASLEKDYTSGYMDGDRYRAQNSKAGPVKAYQLKLPEAPSCKSCPPPMKRPGYARKQLEDSDPMPFGKHRGEPMSDVPVKYLHWLWEQGHKTDPNSSIGDYIRRNLDALQQEEDDLIWE